MPSKVSGDGGSYIPACLLLSVANVLSQWNFTGSRSTYICPLSSWGPILVPGVQVLSMVLECFIIIRAANLLQNTKLEGTSHKLSTDKSNDPTFIIASALTVRCTSLLHLKIPLTRLDCSHHTVSWWHSFISDTFSILAMVLCYRLQLSCKPVVVDCTFSNLCSSSGTAGEYQFHSVMDKR